MKKLLIITLSAITLVLVFVAGSVSQANSNWVAEVMSNARSDIGTAGYDKRDEIVDRINSGLGEVMTDALESEISESESNVEQALEEYYDSLLYDLENSQAYQDVKSDINDHEDVIFERYKEDIDEAFGTLE